MWFMFAKKGRLCLANFVSLSMGSEVLTLLNLKPAVIITTVGKDESINAAPYSCFSIVDYNPPRH